jgi:Putative zinc-finger
MIEHVSELDLVLAFDGELPADRIEAVRAHARECAACEEKWTGLAQLSHQVAALHPEVVFPPQEAAVGALLSRMNQAPAQKKTHWTSRSLVFANTVVAIAAAITCIVMLPALRVTKHPAAHAPLVYDLEPVVPAGYVSLPFADPALPLDDTAVLPVELSAEDLELMGLNSSDGAAGEPGEGVRAEILIGMDGWPRAIRIVDQF